MAKKNNLCVNCLHDYYKAKRFIVEKVYSKEYFSTFQPYNATERSLLALFCFLEPIKFNENQVEFVRHELSTSEKNDIVNENNYLLTHLPKDMCFVNISIWNPKTLKRECFHSAIKKDMADSPRYLKIWNKIYYPHTNKLINENLYTINDSVDLFQNNPRLFIMH